MVVNGHVVFANRAVIKRGGGIIGAVGMFQDISESKIYLRNWKSVRAINKELDAVFESVHTTDSSSWMNRGVVLRVNKGGTRRWQGFRMKNIGENTCMTSLRKGISDDP